ncbi:hypothetical protein ACLKA6_012286 [Drosophila palustris]
MKVPLLHPHWMPATALTIIKPLLQDPLVVDNEEEDLVNDFGIGECSSALEDKEEKPIAFMSKKLRELTEQGTEREC